MEDEDYDENCFQDVLDYLEKDGIKIDLEDIHQRYIKLVKNDSFLRLWVLYLKLSALYNEHSLLNHYGRGRWKNFEGDREYAKYCLNLFEARQGVCLWLKKILGSNWTIKGYHYTGFDDCDIRLSYDEIEHLEEIMKEKGWV